MSIVLVQFDAQEAEKVFSECHLEVDMVNITQLELFSRRLQHHFKQSDNELILFIVKFESS